MYGAHGPDRRAANRNICMVRKYGTGWAALGPSPGKKRGAGERCAPCYREWDDGKYFRNKQNRQGEFGVRPNFPAFSLDSISPGPNCPVQGMGICGIIVPLPLHLWNRYKNNDALLKGLLGEFMSTYNTSRGNTSHCCIVQKMQNSCLSWWRNGNPQQTSFLGFFVI